MGPLTVKAPCVVPCGPQVNSIPPELPAGTFGGVAVNGSQPANRGGALETPGAFSLRLRVTTANAIPTAATKRTRAAKYVRRIFIVLPSWADGSAIQESQPPSTALGDVLLSALPVPLISPSILRRVRA